MARSDDAGKLKCAVIEWVNDLDGPSDPTLRANSKVSTTMIPAPTPRRIRLERHKVSEYSEEILSFVAA